VRSWPPLTSPVADGWTDGTGSVRPTAPLPSPRRRMDGWTERAQCVRPPPPTVPPSRMDGWMDGWTERAQCATVPVGGPLVALLHLDLYTAIDRTEIGRANRSPCRDQVRIEQSGPLSSGTLDSIPGSVPKGRRGWGSASPVFFSATSTTVQWAQRRRRSGSRSGTRDTSWCPCHQLERPARGVDGHDHREVDRRRDQQEGQERVEEVPVGEPAAVDAREGEAPRSRAGPPGPRRAGEQSLTSALITAPKAAPITTATARSTSRSRAARTA
jgi:hypothetical protein